jgi:transposase
MSKKQHRYDAEFRRKAIALSELPDKTATIVEKELGIYQGAISAWKRSLQKHGEDAFPGKGRKAGLEAEIALLRKQLKDRELECEILKKAMGYFAKNGK